MYETDGRAVALALVEAGTVTADIGGGLKTRCKATKDIGRWRTVTLGSTPTFFNFF